jgi:hypothetical protein
MPELPAHTGAAPQLTLATTNVKLAASPDKPAQTP